MSRTPTALICGTAVALILSAAPASAQATRTFVSGVGNDADPCSRTAPCRTFAGAFVQDIHQRRDQLPRSGRIRRRHDHEVDHHRLHRHDRIDPGERRDRRHRQHPGERERPAPLGAAARTDDQRPRRVRNGRHAHRHRRHPGPAGHIGVRRGYRHRRIRPAGHRGGGLGHDQSDARQCRHPQHQCERRDARDVGRRGGGVVQQCPDRRHAARALRGEQCARQYPRREHRAQHDRASRPAA